MLASALGIDHNAALCLSMLPTFFSGIYSTCERLVLFLFVLGAKGWGKGCLVEIHQRAFGAKRNQHKKYDRKKWRQPTRWTASALPDGRMHSTSRAFFGWGGVGIFF